jgi:hypothetical protein
MDCKKEIKGLRAEIATLRNVCGKAYQLAGTYGADVKALDNLLAAAEGKPIPHESFLPVSNQWEDKEA